MRGMKTVGVLRELPEEGVVEIGVPVGVVAAILPTTNPTSTAIYKTLISLKAGNAIVLSPHPQREALHLRDGRRAVSARRSKPARPRTSSVHHHAHARSHQRADAARAHGRHPLHRRARHRARRLIRAASRPSASGPGNVPVLVERTADVAEAVAKIVEGKSFDYGTVCSSEQAMVAEESLRDRIIAELKARKAYFCNAAQKEALAQTAAHAELGP